MLNLEIGATNNLKCEMMLLGRQLERTACVYEKTGHAWSSEAAWLERRRSPPRRHDDGGLHRRAEQQLVSLSEILMLDTNAWKVYGFACDQTAVRTHVMKPGTHQTTGSFLVVAMNGRRGVCRGVCRFEEAGDVAGSGLHGCVSAQDRFLSLVEDLRLAEADCLMLRETTIIDVKFQLQPARCSPVAPSVGQ